VSWRQLVSSASPRDPRLRLALVFAACSAGQPSVWPEGVPHHSTSSAGPFGLDAGFPQDL
jgi:hypothetical protein